MNTWQSAQRTDDATPPTPNTLRGGIIASYVAAVVFFVHISLYFVPYVGPYFPALRGVAGSLAFNEVDAMLGVVEHLLLFPVIAALPAPSWARSAGYGWLVIDMATDIMQLNGAPVAVYLTLRYGGHIASAVWAAAASWQARGALRVIGLLYAADLVIFSFVAFVRLSFLILLPSLILLPVWLLLIGRRLARTSDGAQQATSGGA